MAFQSSLAENNKTLWSSPLKETLTLEKRDHFVQFYESEAFLIRTVVDFAISGLRYGHGIVLIATQTHLETLKKELKARGVDIYALINGKQFLFLDAKEILSRFMVNEMPDKKKFNDSIGDIVRQTYSRFGGLRAFGEMASLLVEKSNLQGALALELLWRELAEENPITLLCGYHMGQFGSENQSAAFKAVCDGHIHVVPADGFADISDPEARRRIVTSLQQKARVLEFEIMKRKENEEALKEALQIRDEFLSIAGHELKTPLTSLILQAQMLQRKMSLTGGEEGAEQKMRIVQNINLQALKLAKLVEHLLDLTRIRLGKMTLEYSKFNLSDVVRQIVSDFSTESDSEPAFPNKSFKFLHIEGPVVGVWDRSRIEQVIANLLSNAMKYGDQKPITISLYKNRTKSRAVVIVKDEGKGIDAENQKRIFGRFERACSPNNYSGLGLGLYVVKQIVDAHGGTISVESEVGKGATFKVELPLQTERIT